MVAIGDDHQEMAEFTRPRIEKILNIQVNTITEGDPFDVKLDLLNDNKNVVLFIDCDLVLFNWNWACFNFRHLNFALDQLHPSWPGTHAIQRLMPDPKAPIINSGLWLAHPQHQPVFKLAKLLSFTDLKDFEYKLGDQTPLNLAIQLMEREVNVLPQSFNRQYMPKVTADPPPGKDFGVHLIGGTFEGDTASKRDRVINYCRKYPL